MLKGSLFELRTADSLLGFTVVDMCGETTLGRAAPKHDSNQTFCGVG